MRLTLACFAALVTIASACGHRNEPSPVVPPVTPTPPPAIDPAAPAVTLKPEGKPAARVSVKVARSDEQRRQGLMFVQNLPPENGMLFLFEEEGELAFWMHNTMIPLDMIFIGSNMQVVGVVENAVPLSEESRSVGRPSRYVLEVNGGWARAHGVGAGTAVEFQNAQ